MNIFSKQTYYYGNKRDAEKEAEGQKTNYPLIK